MAGRYRRWLVAGLAALVVALGTAGTAGAQLAPPWCGTPEPDAAGNLPDGSLPTDPVGSFAHIPYYAIGCTLDSIAAQSNGRMKVEVAGHSALGRPMYGVVINALDTQQQQRDFARWQKLRSLALDNPREAQKLLAKWGDNVKIPIFNQSGIHGGEFEGVDSNMQLISDLATTPYGTDPRIDNVLDHMILVFNVVQNPDGRVVGQRANGNGFDLNRDYLTQSQSETQASVALQQKWLAPEALDLHGYVTPTLVESTTKPHNPGIEYDLYIPWNQARSDANEAGLAAIGLGTTRPVNDWCPEADFPGPTGLCEDGSTPGPAVAEGWDDWGPFYTGQYAQLLGFDSSTVEMCNSTGTACSLPGATDFPRGRYGAFRAQQAVSWSTMEFDVANRQGLLDVQLEVYRRGVKNADRPSCCPAPFDVANNWMTEYPKAHVIPFGKGQRSDAEANRLVRWLLANGIEVDRLDRDTSFGGQKYEEDSYVVWMSQALRGLANTALSIGVDISADISRLYAPPGAWSHGYLWGADVVEIPRDAKFKPKTSEIRRPNRIDGGVESGSAGAYALELDSATAVRAVNALVGAGTPAQLATEASGKLPAGSVLFAADKATRDLLKDAGRTYGLTFRKVKTGDIPATEPIDRVPRIAVLTGAVNQDVWSLRNLGFTADPVSVAINTALTDPLANYDVIWNTGGWPSAANPMARERLTAFFAAGGGYMGAGANGANFLTAGAQVVGLTPATRTGSGRSGIVRWSNEGGVGSPIVGTYPSQDTAIVDPPTWFSAVPASLAVDARLLQTGFFAAGLWLLDAQSATAPGSPLVVHGPNDAGTARLTAFALNPLYRADPEREWPMVGGAAYWADQ